MPVNVKEPIEIVIGQKWMTRDGREAIIQIVLDEQQRYPVRGRIGGNESHWTLGGRFFANGSYSELDLMMLVEDATKLPPVVKMDVHETAQEIAGLATMEIAGYESLASVLREAYAQAAVGKGHERHSNGEPFDSQVMADMAHRFGVGALLGQAFKKSEESQRLDDERAIKELLGAINYLAGAVIAIRRVRKVEGLV